MKRSVILGTGHYLPEKVLSNADLSKMVDTSDEWITQRTGIKQRHIAAEGELTSTLGIRAAEEALRHSGLKAQDIDLVLVATSSPDNTFPSTATKIQAALGITRGFALDLQAVCSGFIYALATADSYIKTGLANNVLVIGAETFSRLLDWSDRTTCVLFGDGAGAVVVQGIEEQDAQGRGILTAHLRADGSHHDKLYVDGGPSLTKTTGHIHMQGREVFKHAVGMITDVIEAAFDATGTCVDDIDWFVPHQANRRIIESSARKLNIPMEKVVVTVDRHGNTSAASIPLALHCAVSKGKIKRTDLVLLEAMGGGFTWGSVLLRF
jgi:3-oxoacyl-[acyl-carrier-protein] synthase-3